MSLLYGFYLCLLCGAERTWEHDLRANELQPKHQAKDCSNTSEATTLRTVLGKLGLQPEDLQGDLSKVRGIDWDKRTCQARGIQLKRAAGRLPEEISKLTGLRKLVLSGGVTGGVEVLHSLPWLTKLDLSGTLVEGDLGFARALPRLTDLRLNGARVQGDLKRLGALKILELDRTAVFGSVRSLALERLMQLRAAASQVEGDLSAFQNARCLRTLDLRHTQVQGDLAMLANSSLTELRLGSTQVTGNLQALGPVIRKCQQRSCGLRVLDLELTQVHGSLDVFASGDQLTKLMLRRTKVAGDLKGLSQHQLTRLDLASTEVEGSIAALHLETLLQLDLAKTSVAGPLGAFNTSAKLKGLRLDGTRVSGDLAGLEAQRRLESLGLGRCGVSGELRRLRAMARLGRLELGHTQVSGSLEDLPKGLQTLDLSATRVTGELGAIRAWPNAQLLKLSKTGITGAVTSAWRGCCRHLRSLDLSDSNVSFIPPGGDPGLQQVFSPAWEEEDLVQPLLFSPLVALRAAECNLTGQVEELRLRNVMLNKALQEDRPTELEVSLRSLDVSSNRLELRALPGALTVANLANNPRMLIDNATLLRVLEGSVFAELRGVRLVNTQLAEAMLEQKKLLKGKDLSFSDAEHGYDCYDVVNPSLVVSPPLFLPRQLCECMPGWYGLGTNCTKCPPGSYSSAHNQAACAPCPAGASGPEGAAGVAACVCATGQLFGGFCGCPAGRAMTKEESCELCGKLQLQCSRPLSRASAAPPLPGCARLAAHAEAAFKCLPPEARCPGNASGESLGCAPGYGGPLCADCAEGFRSSGGLCVACAPLLAQKTRLLWALAAAAAAAVAVMLLLLARGRAEERSEVSPAARRMVLLGLAKLQAPLLLQLLQLYAVLAQLAGAQQLDRDTAGDEGFLDAFWEKEYVAAMQLTLASVQDSFQVQCLFDAQAVRLLGALAAPLLPLLVLLLCGALELCKFSLGASSAFKALTLFFIGGACSCGRLLSCQRLDGGGQDLGHFAFRKALPQLSCLDTSPLSRWVDAVGYSTAVVYGFVIPCLLLYLFLRQHLLLKVCKTSVALAESSEGQLLTRLHPLRQGASEKGLKAPDSWLLASCAAHMAVLLRGEATLQLQSGEAKMTAVDHRGDAVELNVGSLVETLQAKSTAETLRCRQIVEMLTERCVVEEAVEHDRLLAGAKEVFFKYAFCRYVWMEVVLKLLAVALVAVVLKEDGLCFALAITLGMAAAIAMTQPYVQPQINELHCCCFLCLALAAVGFSWHWLRLARLSMALPPLLAAVQVLRPDSCEALAVRLFQELKEKLPELQRGEVVQLQVEFVSFA
ncbi:unnamed protein product [Effrenium voratum]|uniref:Uncharacterized protein n=1 Tax=Effrenium voratum TaxID=2562239 RepID=A0AA36I135_9DINO|nr:unnamed protein product [Effrenium voratum]